jgi:hypothetical protein
MNSSRFVGRGVGYARCHSFRKGERIFVRLDLPPSSAITPHDKLDRRVYPVDSLSQLVVTVRRVAGGADRGGGDDGGDAGLQRAGLVEAQSFVFGRYLVARGGYDLIAALADGQMLGSSVAERW